MLLYPLPALLTPFSRTITIKDNSNNGRNPPSCPFPVTAFINKEATSCINEEAIGAINDAVIGGIIAQKNPPFFISCFTVSVAPSVNRLDFSSDYDFNNIIHISI